VNAHIIIGLKRLSDAKQRLHPALTPAQRRDLMLAMLATVTHAAHESRLGPVALATSEPAAHQLGEELDVDVISDAGLEWNAGLVHALATVSPEPDGVLFLAGDLPLLTAADLRAFARTGADVAVAIARADDGGTNALLVRPPFAMSPMFGRPGSAAVHAARARELSLDHVIVDIPGLSLDVDTIDDARRAGCLPP
jgi:2-phospho-L-lactate guanylyltransferase